MQHAAASDQAVPPASRPAIRDLAIDGFSELRAIYDVASGSNDLLALAVNIRNLNITHGQLSSFTGYPSPCLRSTWGEFNSEAQRTPQPRLGLPSEPGNSILPQALVYLSLPAGDDLSLNGVV